MIETIGSWPWWVLLPLGAGFAIGAFIVVMALFQALVILAEEARRGSLRLAARLSALFVQAGLSAACAARAGLHNLALLLFWPLRVLWEHTAGALGERLALAIEASRQREELRQTWQREFRDQFPTFKAFREAFESGGKAREEPRFEERSEHRARNREPPRPPPPKPPPQPDPRQVAFARACRVLGLPESGFTLSEMNARYRALISAAHPDRGGSVARAAALNAARDLIKQRRGWT